MFQSTSFVVVDLETTGSLPDTDRVIEIGAVKVERGEIIDSFNTLVNPGKNIPHMITWLTGITTEMVADAPSFHEIAKDFRAFIGKSIFVAHNAHFDYGFANSEFVRASLHPLKNQKLCTIKLSRQVFPGLLHYNLPALCRTFKISHPNAHRAPDDSKATAELLIKMLSKMTIQQDLQKHFAMLVS